VVSGAVAAELDLRGEICPFTFVRTKLRLEEMQAGEALRIVVDHEPASRNVPRSLRDWGQEVIRVGAGAEPGTWVIDVVKSR
jgi:tRNA 2-thiouridine synthesizing protein A